jgi:pimeloyl-ACP methyl ester carboxylesterase
MYVKETGTPGAPTIVFLHGMGTSGWMWEVQTEDLNDFHCLNVDLPGHGRSNHLPWVSLADTADQIAALIQERGTHQRAYVVGLSLGGYLTLTLLDRHPELIERAVLSGVTTAPLPNRRVVLAQATLMSIFLKSKWFARMQAKMLRIPEDVLDVYTENFMAMSRPAFMTVVREALNFTLPPNLKQVTVPTLVTAGSEELKPVLDGVAEIAELMPNAAGCLAPGGHHGWNGEAPDLFSAMLRAWFTEDRLPDELERVEAEFA